MNKQDYEKLRQNLVRHHVYGIENSCTPHPIFMVQKQKIIWGVDSDYGYDKKCIHDNENCESYENLLEYFAGQDQDYDEEFLPDLLDMLSIDLEDDCDVQEYGGLPSCFEVWKKYQEVCDLTSEEEVLQGLELRGSDLTLTYGSSTWEDVTMFLDRDSAEEFLASFGYRHGKMRIYVRSGWENNQYRGLISAMIEGKLVWNEEDS